MIQKHPLLKDVQYPIWVYDKNKNLVYYENEVGMWFKSTYNQLNLKTSYENSQGYECRWVYDEKGELIFSADSDGEYFSKKEYHSKQTQNN